MDLAGQHIDKGRQARDQIASELEARLQQLKAGEEHRYQHEAEQLCRQMLQTSKLHMDTELDRLRWALVQAVLADVHKHLEKTHEDPTRYQKVLATLLSEASAVIPEGTLVVELNPRDIENLQPVWESIVASVAPGRKIKLASLTDHASGGIMVRSEDGRLRVDNTFEGRMSRMQDELLGVIMENLFVQNEGKS